jgi:hypothetical protein
LLAMFGSALSALAVLVVLRLPRHPLVLRAAAPHGRLRLPVRVFEQAVVVATIAVASAVVSVAPEDVGLWLGASALAASVLFAVHRGVFAPLRADQENAGKR